jgi:hypothetical protein
MRSARTDRPAGPVDALASAERPTLPSPPRATGRRRLGATSALVGLALLVLLAACAGSSAQEARRGQARDAASSPVLPKAQATRTSQRFFPTATPPKPTPPPLPTLGSLVITLGLGGDGSPQGSYASVPADAGTAYAAALLRDVYDGQVAAARWVDAAGGTWATSKVEIEADADQTWVGLPLTLNGAIPPGEYAVYLFVGERRIGSLLFRIDPVGSAGQLLPEPPLDPQADRGGPGQPPPGQGGQQTPGAGGQPIQGGLTPAPADGQGVPAPLYGEPGAAPTAYPGQVPPAQEPVPVEPDPGFVPADPATGGEWVPTQTP